MPELPDVTIYVESIAARVVGATLEGVRLVSPFLLRTHDPTLASCAGRSVRGVRRLGKRVVIELEGHRFLVVHLMVAGRFRWGVKGEKVPGKIGLSAFDFSSGSLLLTEASSKKRASLMVVDGEAALLALHAGGLEPIGATLDAFRSALLAERHTLKRTLTDPRIFSGIGNAYSDEILHRAQLSPVKLNTALGEREIERLHRAVESVLAEWTTRLRDEAGGDFPRNVTAFRPEMAVHGKYGQPCPVCGAKVQRIVYAENETNYCATCQTGGKLLADRALSRLLAGDWPKTLQELEEAKAQRRA